jgi:hypothetical protein
MPSLQPSCKPFQEPSSQPLSQPSAIPSSPSMQPTLDPSLQPTTAPSRKPSFQPVIRTPSNQPSVWPTAPSSQPSMQPLLTPTCNPSAQPSSSPSFSPTLYNESFYLQAPLLKTFFSATNVVHNQEEVDQAVFSTFSYMWRVKIGKCDDWTRFIFAKTVNSLYFGRPIKVDCNGRKWVTFSTSKIGTVFCVDCGRNYNPSSCAHEGMIVNPCQGYVGTCKRNEGSYAILGRRPLYSRLLHVL